MLNVNAILGDCLKEMQNIPNKSVDMILCDLPYQKTRNRNDKLIPFEPLWKEYKRIIKDNGCIALFAQGTFYVDLVNSNRKWFRYDLVWDKVLTSGFLNAKHMPLRQHEQIAIFYKEQPTYNPQFTEGKPLHSKGINYKSKKHNGQNYGDFKNLEDTRVGSTQKYPTSIIKFKKVHSSKALHPTEKSIECLKWLIKTYTNKGEMVLDNCAGSFTTAIACMETNRNCIVIEKDKTTFDIGRQRLSNYNKGGGFNENGNT